jgi:hypothetical protein
MRKTAGGTTYFFGLRAFDKTWLEECWSWRNRTRRQTTWPRQEARARGQAISPPQCGTKQWRPPLTVHPSSTSPPLAGLKLRRTLAQSSKQRGGTYLPTHFTCLWHRIRRVCLPCYTYQALVKGKAPPLLPCRVGALVGYTLERRAEVLRLEEALEPCQR